MEFPEDEVCSTKINASQEQLQNEYASKDGKQILSKEMSGPTYDVLSRVFMALSKIKIIAARKFESAEGYKCISCSFGANQGLLYPLEKSIFFIWKPVSYIRHADIAHIEILRMEQSHNIKMFDLQLKLHSKDQPLTFTGIDRAEYENLMRYFLKKPNLQILNRSLHESRLNNTMLSSSRSTRTRKNIKSSNNNADIVIPNAGHDDDDEDDEDYNMDDDQDMLDEDDEEDDHHFDKITEPMDISDNDSPKKHEKKKKRRKSEASNNDMISDDEDDDLK